MTTQESEGNPVKVLRSAVDYLTITTKEGRASAALIQSLYALKDREFWFKERNKAWSFMGYRGRAYEGIRYGIRGDEAIVMLSGPQAGTMWSEIARKRQRCTRIDLAVTIDLACQDMGVGKRAYEQAVKFWSGKSSQVMNSRGGTTVYLGSRTSDYMGRLYDKGAESGLPSGWVWRYEIEIKKKVAEGLLNRMLDTGDVGNWIADYVWSWYSARGVTPIFGGRNTDSAIEISASIPSDEKSLSWLSSQVKPTVKRLLVNGKLAEVKEALGLPSVDDIFYEFRKELDNGSR